MAGLGKPTQPGDRPVMARSDPYALHVDGSGEKGSGHSRLLRQYSVPTPMRSFTTGSFRGG